MKSREEVLYRFAGDFSNTPVDRLAEEVRTRLQEVPVPSRARSRLFASFVEMTQNVIHYAAPDPMPGGARRKGSIELGAEARGFWIRCTNQVRADHASRLRERLAAICDMSPGEITAAYRQRLNDTSPRSSDPLSRGAGLGLLAIARNSSLPLDWELNVRDAPQGAWTFSLRATVDPSSEIAR